MKRQIGIFIVIAHVFLFATIQVSAQHAPAQQSPSIPDDVLRSQLIAWSQLQKPEPITQTQPQSQKQRAAQRSDQPSIPAQTFADRADSDGTNIERANQDGNRSVPRVANRGDEFEDGDAKY